jgi:hypothetical protein
MNNQQLKAHCEDVIANPQDHLDWVVDMAKEALAALTQPASPALKLPDAFSPHDAKMFCAAHGVTGAYELASKMANYAVDKVVRLNAPHTAPIEPICATGGAEWVNVPREPTRQMMSQGHFAMAGTDRGKFRRIYQAMIAAAPEEE